MTLELRIIGFHNCDGCTRKVKTALRKIGGVELMEFDRETGKATVSSAKNSELIRYALEFKLKKPVVILSREIIPANQNLNSIVSRDLLTEQRPFGLHELGEVVLKLAKDLDGVEVTHSNTIKVKFNHRDNSPAVSRQARRNIGFHIQDVDDEYVLPQPPPRTPPRAATEPSAPPMSLAEEVVYGYPPEFYGFPTTCNHNHPNGYCNIM